jgi:hypothetical protein
MPLGTVKSRTTRAFEKLRAELALEDTLQEAFIYEVCGDPPQPSCIRPWRAGARGGSWGSASSGFLSQLLGRAGKAGVLLNFLPGARM